MEPRSGLSSDGGEREQRGRSEDGGDSRTSPLLPPVDAASKFYLVLDV